MSQNVQKFINFQKFQLENLVDFEKCCKTHILNYFLAKIGADTAVNEQHFAEILPTDAEAVAQRRRRPLLLRPPRAGARTPRASARSSAAPRGTWPLHFDAF